jgi:hypothetical protein
MKPPTKRPITGAGLSLAQKKGLTVNEQIASLSVDPTAGSFIRDMMRLLTSYDSMEMSINIDQFSCGEKLATLTYRYDYTTRFRAAEADLSQSEDLGLVYSGRPRSAT